MDDFVKMLNIALMFTAKAAATEMFKGQDVRSHLISAQELSDLRTELIQWTLVSLQDGTTPEEIEQHWNEKMKFIKSVTK